jgi:hypothetical protein
VDVGDVLAWIADLICPTLPWGSDRKGGTADTKSAPVATTRELGEDDNGRMLNLRKGDVLTIMLPVHPTPSVTTRLVSPDAQKLLVIEDATHDQWHDVRCRAVGMGESRLEIEYVGADGSKQSTWSVDLSVTD